MVERIVPREDSAPVLEAQSGPALSPLAPSTSFPIPPRQPTSRRRLLAAAASLLVVPLVPRIAWAANVVAVRTWPADEYTRVTLELDRALRAEHFTLSNPNRLVVDLQGVDLNGLRELVSKIQPNDPYIGSVRVGQNVPGVVRLVFDLKQPIVPQVFTLKPIADYQHRLVLDLYPTQIQDPLMALLGPDDDPLARVIEELRIGTPGVDRTPAPPSPPSADPPAVARVEPQPQPQPQPQPSQSSAEALMRATPPPPPPAARPAPSRGGAPRRQLTIMIDPGHGGEDPGAIGPTGLREKDVVLAIGRMLKERIDSVPGMRALMTRDRDFFVPLNARVLKARQAKADLFVSVHADAFTRRSANGSSVYALSERGASSTSARLLAQRENAADLVGGINIGSHDAAIAKVLLDLSTTAQIGDSIRLGTNVLTHMGRINRLHKPRVEQAAFAVLRSPDIPSILVETAFISNPGEERKLRTASFQQQMAVAILGGIRGYVDASPALANTTIASR